MHVCTGYCREPLEITPLLLHLDNYQHGRNKSNNNSNSKTKLIDSYNPHAALKIARIPEWIFTSANFNIALSGVPISTIQQRTHARLNSGGIRNSVSTF